MYIHTHIRTYAHSWYSKSKILPPALARPHAPHYIVCILRTLCTNLLLLLLLTAAEAEVGAPSSHVVQILFLIAPNNECVSPITHLRARRRLRLGRVAEDWTIGPSEGDGRRVLSDMPRYVFPVPTQCLLCCATCSSFTKFLHTIPHTSYTTHKRDRQTDDTYTHIHTGKAGRQTDVHRRTYTYLPTYLHTYILLAYVHTYIHPTLHPTYIAPLHASASTSASLRLKLASSKFRTC
ncbi:hypothetical protein F4809DRAFT_113637 [Biscogniauxia mediterranea]|nr:hypothetical protein F4809DRAFT_113637 [Biscogniauxia mediterranea]